MQAASQAQTNAGRPLTAALGAAVLGAAVGPHIASHLLCDGVHSERSVSTRVGSNNASTPVCGCVAGNVCAGSLATGVPLRLLLLLLQLQLQLLLLWLLILLQLLLWLLLLLLLLLHVR